MTTKTDLIQPQREQRRHLGNLLWISPAAMATAAIANLALYQTAGQIFPSVTAWSGAGIGQIIGATSAYLFMGTLVFALVARFSSRPARHYQIIAALGLILSLGLPIAAGFGYAAPGALPADLATVVTLSLMHVVTYAISVPLFVRQMRINGD